MDDLWWNSLKYLNIYQIFEDIYTIRDTFTYIKHRDLWHTLIYYYMYIIYLVFKVLCIDTLVYFLELEIYRPMIHCCWCISYGYSYLCWFPKNLKEFCFVGWRIHLLFCLQQPCMQTFLKFSIQLLWMKCNRNWYYAWNS